MRKETQTRLQYQVSDSVISDDGSFEYDFITGIGNDAPSHEILNFVTAWNRAEGGDKTAKFNPLNTTQPMPGDTCFNQLSGRCGVRNYASYEDGLEANITTVTNGRYERLLEGLRLNNVELALSGLSEGVWGTDASLVSTVYFSLPVPMPAQAGPLLSGSARADLVNYALSLQGLLYITGGGSASFRAGEDGAGGDCSSTIQHIYQRVLGIEIGTNTFSQFTNRYSRGGESANPNMREIDVSDLLPGDLWYGRYPNDEHVGMIVGDVTGDGTMDLIDNGGKKNSMGVNNDFLNDPYFMDNLVGFGRVLDD